MALTYYTNCIYVPVQIIVYKRLSINMNVNKTTTKKEYFQSAIHQSLCSGLVGGWAAESNLPDCTVT